LAARIRAPQDATIAFLALTATDVAAWSLDMAEQGNTKSKMPVQKHALHEYMEIGAAFAILAGISMSDALSPTRC
jgi:hypothetical protein